MSDTIEISEVQNPSYVCQKCNGKLRHGMRIDKGIASHVVWCHSNKPQCLCSIGTGKTLELAFADLEKNCGKQKVKK